MPTAEMTISMTLLKECLHLPDDTEILSVGPSDHSRGFFRMVILHPDAPQRQEGCFLPKADATFKGTRFEGWTFRDGDKV